ncbi:hypothetical protein SAMN05192529_108141 [Arachidicoccus rhizosphaerae]|uniref:Uncharacterized protein n=1 Tax=Arachidicoccus rhizosphaerae TaxID=551991 RepID=A0A1H3YLY7_9BACT|nr:hypothetical protein [Arachidicoccus rhizosphaerae]SEA12044.1 hypothetical protein SAMN05192529_108141 [Arachidicoccus rhizosphaerae]
MEKNLRYTGPEGTPLLETINKMERLYQVPVAYFEGLAEEIMTKIRLGNLSGHLGFQVPEGYFAGLADQIMHRILSEQHTDAGGRQSLNSFQNAAVASELNEIAPFLLQIGNQNVYRVPAGYFERLSPLGYKEQDLQIQTTADAQGGKVIALTPRKRIWRTAVAAAAVVVVLFSGQRFFTNHHDAKVLPVSNNQFASKISTNNDSFAAGLSELSDEEIMGYLSTPDPAQKDSMSQQADEETQKAISNMTNEELENYLDRTPATY